MAGFVAGLWPGCGRVCGRIVAGLWPGCGRVCGRIVAGLWPGLWPGCGRVCDRVFGRSVRKISFAVDFVALLTFVPCRMWLKIICQLRPPLKKTRIYTHIYIYIRIHSAWIGPAPPPFVFISFGVVVWAGRAKKRDGLDRIFKGKPPQNQ
jgi:hypothetical protein